MSDSMREAKKAAIAKKSVLSSSKILGQPGRSAVRQGISYSKVISETNLSLNANSQGMTNAEKRRDYFKSKRNRSDDVVEQSDAKKVR